MALPIIFSQTLAAAAANNVSASQSPGSGAILINGSAASGGVATLDAQRRVIVTSGGNDTGIIFTVIGTNGAGNPITETITGASGAAAQTNLDFKTVMSVTHTGSIASTVIIGTNGVASSLWQIVNWNTQPFNLGYSVELRSGAVNFTVQHTYDDPNNILTGLGYPTPFNDPVVNGASATAEGSYTTPITAIRLLTNSGTGTLWFRMMQEGITSP